MTGTAKRVPSSPVNEADRKAAREAIWEAWDNCRHTNAIGQIGKPCACDIRLIAGCMAKVEAIAKAIANARSPVSQ